mmetsp:Transcript_876/g.2176  ORF Transcript_876/g.2176 Transcript_876/m.2176 type:complete len:615 (-) Transcript_876:351-2195(-)
MAGVAVEYICLDPQDLLNLLEAPHQHAVVGTVPLPQRLELEPRLHGLGHPPLCAQFIEGHGEALLLELSLHCDDAVGRLVEPQGHGRDLVRDEVDDRHLCDTQQPLAKHFLGVNPHDDRVDHRLLVAVEAQDLVKFRFFGSFLLRLAVYTPKFKLDPDRVPCGFQRSLFRQPRCLPQLNHQHFLGPLVLIQLASPVLVPKLCELKGEGLGALGLDGVLLREGCRLLRVGRDGSDIVHVWLKGKLHQHALARAPRLLVLDYLGIVLRVVLHPRPSLLASRILDAQHANPGGVGDAEARADVGQDLHLKLLPGGDRLLAVAPHIPVVVLDEHKELCPVGVKLVLLLFDNVAVPQPPPLRTGGLDRLKLCLVRLPPLPLNLLLPRPHACRSNDLEPLVPLELVLRLENQGFGERRAGKDAREVRAKDARVLLPVQPGEDNLVLALWEGLPVEQVDLRVLGDGSGWQLDKLFGDDVTHPSRLGHKVCVHLIGRLHGRVPEHLASLAVQELEGLPPFLHHKLADDAVELKEGGDAVHIVPHGLRVLHELGIVHGASLLLLLWHVFGHLPPKALLGLRVKHLRGLAVRVIKVPDCPHDLNPPPCHFGNRSRHHLAPEELP